MDEQKLKEIILNVFNMINAAKPEHEQYIVYQTMRDEFEKGLSEKQNLELDDIFDEQAKFFIVKEVELVEFTIKFIKAFSDL